MNFIWDKITEWLKGLLVGGIVSNLSGLFDSINTRVADVASTVGIVAWDADVRHVDSDFIRFSLPPYSLSSFSIINHYPLQVQHRALQYRKSAPA